MLFFSPISCWMGWSVDELVTPRLQTHFRICTDRCPLCAVWIPAARAGRRKPLWRVQKVLRSNSPWPGRSAPSHLFVGPADGTEITPDQPQISRKRPELQRKTSREEELGQWEQQWKVTVKIPSPFLRQRLVMWRYVIAAVSRYTYLKLPVRRLFSLSVSLRWSRYLPTYVLPTQMKVNLATTWKTRNRTFRK